MVTSMARFFIEYCFTQGDYNDIMVMQVDMNSDGAIGSV